MIAALAVGCIALTTIIHLAGPEWAFLEFDDLREGQLEAAAAMVMTVAGAVLLGRFRRHGSRRMLVVAAALFVLAAENFFAAIATPLVDSLAENRFTTWTAAGSAAVGAALLATAAIPPDRTVVHRTRAMVVVLGASASALVVIAGGSWTAGESLPRAFDAIPRQLEGLPLLDEHPVLLLVELATATAYALAAARFSALAAFDDVLMRWLSFGAVIAAAAFVNYALFPSQFTELLYAGDAFFLAAMAVLLFGAILDVTGTEASIVRGAVASERQRVAGELRAGVAQELALMATKTQWIASRPDAHHRVGELAESVERALDESRGAISSLVRPVDEPVAHAVAHAATDAGDRNGVRVELDLDADALVSREWREALVRTARESVTMAVRQRGAGLVTVELRNGRHVVLRIADDGRPPARDGVAIEGIGLHGLRERAEALGGTLSVEESSGSGTVVEMVLP